MAKLLTAIFFAALTGGGFPVTAQALVERPPQFVVFSFDNCTELERWQELADFLKEMNKDSERVHFTFFVSGSNFLAQSNRNAYQGPNQRRGYSNINFGGSSADVERRLAFINALHADGNEIASHAVGHFDGRGWSAPVWAQEFESYKKLFQSIGENNDLLPRAGFSFPVTEIAGFRAPYLSVNAGLYAALASHRFRYDASGTGNAADWPEKKDGLWRFKLGNLKLAGSTKYTLSMDYNFFVAQSRARNDPKNQELYRQQMLHTYLHYFRANYSGHRAPIHIGHHFFNYQNGVYHQALQDFARMVCGLPEVRCVSYSKLADFMDRLSPERLRAYQAGDFPRAPEPALDQESALAKKRP